MLAWGGVDCDDGWVLGRVDPQGSLFDTARVFADRLSQDCFYSWLRENGEVLGEDDDFAYLYAEGRGRPSHPPSLMLRALLLQAHDGVSDREAARRSRVDEDWRAALGFDLFHPGLGATTLSLHRARLVIHEVDRVLFQQLVSFAVSSGVLGPKTAAAIDSTAVEGAAACHSARELLTSAMAKVAKALGDPELTGKVEDVVEATRDVSFEDPDVRRDVFSELVVMAQALLEAARNHPGAKAETVLLEALVSQQTEYDADGIPRRRSGRVPDRIASHSDPEARFGKTTGGRSYFGYKLHQLVDVSSEVIVALGVGPANQPDAAWALPLLETARQAGHPVPQIVGDTSYGDARTREALQKRGTEMIAPLPPAPNRNPGRFSKDDFSIDPRVPQVTCPHGVVATSFHWMRNRRGERLMRFSFPQEACSSCPLRDDCTVGTGPRTVRFHPREATVQQARRRLADPQIRAKLRLRHVVERKHDHLKDLGMRKARYWGRRKVELQAYLAGIVANFSRLAVLDALPVTPPAVLAA